MTKQLIIKVLTVSIVFFSSLFQINASDLQGHIALYPDSKGIASIKRTLQFKDFNKINKAIHDLDAKLVDTKSVPHMSISTEFNPKLVHDITECALKISQDDNKLFQEDDKNKIEWSGKQSELSMHKKSMQVKLLELEAKFHKELTKEKSHFVTSFQIDELKILTPDHGGDKKKWLVLMLSPKDKKTKLSNVIFPGNLHITLAKIVSDGEVSDEEFDEQMLPLISAFNEKIKKMNKQQFVNFNSVVITRNFCNEQLACLQHGL